MNVKFKFVCLMFALCAMVMSSCTEEKVGLGNNNNQTQTDDDDDDDDDTTGGNTGGNTGGENTGGENTGDENFDPATVAAAIASAKQYMNDKTYTIVNKIAVPPLGHSKNYYVSMGPYWWPDPSKPDGLPYIRKDGQVNPESRTDYTDYNMMRDMVDAVCSLGNAYYYTKEDAYAKRVQDIVLVFFIQPATMMLPNLEHGQLCPGGCTGRAAGIIESACFVGLVDALAKVSKSPAWADVVDKAMKDWFTEFYNWLLTHEYGVTERNSNSNHGTHFDRQIMAYLAYLGDKDTAFDYLKSDVFPRVEEQVEPDGSQPVELGRTKSWNYALMNLKAWLDNADFAETLGLDLWNYENNGQKYIKSMIDWYLPYLTLNKEWTWDQIATGDLNGIKEVLRRGAEAYPEMKDIYMSVSNNLQPIKTPTSTGGGGIIK